MNLIAQADIKQATENSCSFCRRGGVAGKGKEKDGSVPKEEGEVRATLRCGRCRSRMCGLFMSFPITSATSLISLLGRRLRRYLSEARLGCSQVTLYAHTGYCELVGWIEGGGGEEEVSVFSAKLASRGMRADLLLLRCTSLQREVVCVVRNGLGRDVEPFSARSARVGRRRVKEMRNGLQLVSLKSTACPNRPS